MTVMRRCPKAANSVYDNAASYACCFITGNTNAYFEMSCSMAKLGPGPLCGLVEHQEMEVTADDLDAACG